MVALRQLTHRNEHDLTCRQIEVLQLMAEGLTDQEIAMQMTVSLFTIHLQVLAILENLNVHSRTEAAVRALKEGLIA